MLTAKQRREARREFAVMGVKARNERLTPERRSEIARQASQKRWGDIRKAQAKALGNLLLQNEGKN